jgi:hypothetical protein
MIGCPILFCAAALLFLAAAEEKGGRSITLQL